MNYRVIFTALFLLANSVLAAPIQSFHLNSTAFFPGQAIPSSYTYNGGNQIPPLNWWGEPSGTQQYVILVFDSDAPQANGTSVIHWLVYGIPEGTNDVTGALLEGAPQAPNSFGLAGWSGPAPTAVGFAHHYIFTLYALDTVLNFPLAASSAQIIGQLNGHILAQATLVGTYQKQ